MVCSGRLKKGAPRLTRNQVPPVTNDDIGLKVLREAPAEAAQAIECVRSCLAWSPEPILSHTSIVAIHGIGAHPDDTWCKNVGTAENPRWVNWLDEKDMLPAAAPNARIMRYGYQSQWFGEGAVRQNVSTVAQRLLLALVRKRRVLSLSRRCCTVADLARGTHFAR